MASFSWTFPSFIILPKEGQLQDVVTGLNWVCAASDAGTSTNASGTALLNPPNPEDFIPYSQITEAIALEWLGEIISLQITETELLKALNRLNREFVIPAPPPF
jgi:hypothetical protein